MKLIFVSGMLHLNLFIISTSMVRFGKKIYATNIRYNSEFSDFEISKFISITLKVIYRIVLCR